MERHAPSKELESKAEELRKLLRRRALIAVERAPDQLDETLLAAERESATDDLERTTRLLRQVEIALWRCKNGRYGICLRCEQEISEKRLKAVPWAVYCLACQESVDRLQDRMSSVRASAA